MSRALPPFGRLSAVINLRLRNALDYVFRYKRLGKGEYMGHSDFLFVMPSLLQGIGRTLDIGATAELSNYNLSRTPREADQKAHTADWKAVAGDFATALQEVDAEVTAG